MNALIDVSVTEQDRLTQELKNLQLECAAVLRMVASTRHKEYENLAKIYLWWANAKQLEGFLDGLIVNLDDYRIHAVSHGYNYAPVLMLMFGKTLSDQERNKMSRVLNVLNDEFTRQPEAYRYDAVAKLTGFIKKSGGIVQLVKSTYKKSEISKDFDREVRDEIAVDDFESVQAEQLAGISSELAGMGVQYKVVKRIDKVGNVEIKEKDKVSALSKEADEFWSTNQPHGLANFTSGVAANEDGYSYVLVKRNGTDYVVVNTVDDKKLIKEGLVAAYRKQYSALPNSMRAVCETLRTQLMPINVKLKTLEVVEINPQSEEGEEKLLARNRLLHISKTNQFVLSPVSMPSGVVTTVTLRNPVLEPVEYDVAMASHSKGDAEKHLVGECDFNLYTAPNSNFIPITEDGRMVFSHCMKVMNKANDKKLISLLFQAFTEESTSRYSQPVYSQVYDHAIGMKVSLSNEFVAVLSREFAAPWLENIGTHIGRPVNQLINVKFTHAQMTLSYKYQGGEFKEHKTYSYGQGLSPVQLTDQVFLAKDLMPVLACLGDLPVVGAITFKADHNVLSVSFSTGAADYCIAIPTYDLEKKQRSTVAFASYQPTLRQLTEAEQEERFINSIVDKHTIFEQGADDLLTYEDINVFGVETNG